MKRQHDDRLFSLEAGLSDLASRPSCAGAASYDRFAPCVDDILLARSFFADLQVPTYYPELPVISLLGGYGIYTMHILLIL